MRTIDERAAASRAAAASAAADLQLMIEDREIHLAQIAARAAAAIAARTAEVRDGIEGAAAEMDALLTHHRTDLDAARERLAGRLGDHAAGVRAALDASNDNMAGPWPSGRHRSPPRASASRPWSRARTCVTTSIARPPL